MFQNCHTKYKMKTARYYFIIYLKLCRASRTLKSSLLQELNVVAILLVSSTAGWVFFWFRPDFSWPHLGSLMWLTAVIWQFIWGWLVSDDLVHRSGGCGAMCQLEQCGVLALWLWSFLRLAQPYSNGGTGRDSRTQYEKGL